MLVHLLSEGELSVPGSLVEQAGVLTFERHWLHRHPGRLYVNKQRDNACPFLSTFAASFPRDTRKSHPATVHQGVCGQGWDIQRELFAMFPLKSEATVLNWTSPMLFAGIGGELMQ